MKKATFPNSALVAKKIMSIIEISQSDLGRILGYKNGQLINNNLSGRSCFPAHTWLKLCQMTGIDVEELLEAYLKDKEAWIRQILKGE